MTVSSPNRLSGLAALVAALGIAACADAPDDAPPNGAARDAPTVVLISLDTTRADRLGAYGHAGAHTPTLDALAAAGLRFSAARAPTPITLPSHTTLLTGTLPTAHGVHDNTIFRVADESRLLSEALSEQGWHTGGFVGSYVLDARFGLAQGFDAYTGPEADALGSNPEVVERRGEQVVSDALAWLDGVPRDEPAFLWAHLYDPHHPYAAPESWARRMDDAYDAEIAYADEQVGRLLAGLDATRSTRRLVVVTSDHGESLGEHGEPTHGLFVYDATVRIPLIVSGADIDAGVVTQPVSLADVAPTVLDWAALPDSLLPDVKRASLLDEARRGGPAEPVYVESLLPFHTRRWHPLRGIVWQGHKYVKTVAHELYDLTADPGEQHDLLIGADAATVQLAERLSARLDALLAEHAPLGWAAADTLDPDDAQRLAALGYTTGVGGAAPLIDPALPDPKDRVDDLHAFHEVRDLLHRGRQLLAGEGPGPVHGGDREAAAHTALTRAEELLGILLERTPDDPSLPGHMGLVLLSQERHAEALPWFERATVLDPQPLVTGLNLALCHAALGDEAAALAAVGRVLALEPRFAAAYDWLVAHHEAHGRFGLAAWWRDEEIRAGAADARKVALLTDGGRLRKLARDAGQAVAGPSDG